MAKKDIVRRLLAPEAKDQTAGERQVLNRMHAAAAGGAGLILRKEGAVATAVTGSNSHEDNYNHTIPVKLERENVKLKKKR